MTEGSVVRATRKREIYSGCEARVVPRKIFSVPCSGGSWLSFRVPASQPIHNTFWLVAERALRMGVTALVLGLVARHLEPEGFGQLNFAIMLCGLFAGLANLGLDGLIVSEVVGRSAEAGALLGTALRLRLGAGVLAATGLTLTVFLAPGLRGSAPLVAAASLMLVAQAAEVVDLWFQRHLQSWRTAQARFIAMLLGACVRLAMVAMDAPVVWFAAAQAFDAIFFGTALWLAYRRSTEKAPAWRWDRAVAGHLIRRGTPLAVSSVVVMGCLRLDQFLVKAWLGTAAAGVYFAATRLVDIPLLVAGALGVSLFPGLATARAQDPKIFQARLQAGFDLLSALGWATALGALAVGPWGMRLLYGPAYVGAVPVLLVLAFNTIVVFSSIVRAQFILVAAPTWLHLPAALVGLAVQFPLAWRLMPLLGPPGAAVALAVSCLASGWLTSFAFPSLRPCAVAQTRGLLIPFFPQRWGAARRLLHS
jgi:O-antigen/teichoic acid export membrane protein